MSTPFFLNKKEGQKNQMDRFNALASTMKTKQELRTLEMHLLKPKPIPPYKGAKAGQSHFQKCSMLFMFPNASCVDRIGKQFTINKYITNNIYDIDWVMELISLLEQKHIRWNQTKKKFSMKNKAGKRIEL